MKFKELTSKSETELRKMLSDLQHEAHDLAVKIRTSELKQTHKLKVAKKDIARILTFISSKK
jgi:large subunit ribosomal protein L29